ncbi:MAG TPA: FAD-binding oxidoreductase [Gaiellaceae bacterium]
MTAIAEGLTLEETAVAELSAALRGKIVGRDDPDYDEARKIWNGSIDRRPALIARCAGVADVIAAVRFARAHGLPSTVRSGGHSFPGLSVADDAFVIDLGPMKGVRVDPDAKTARVQAGVLLGELDKETQAFGLAAPAGIVTHTGVAGLTLGGGIGWIQRKHGLSIDKLLSVDVVTAEGELVKASADENPELFWGMRGAGSNFGIVTEFEFELVPLGPTILAGPIFWRMEDSPDVLRFWREWIADAPDELMSIVLHRKAPPLPFVPEELHGEPVVMVVPCWIGDLDAGEKVVKPLREFGNVAADVCVQKPYLAHQAMFDPSFVPHRWYYFRGFDAPELTDEMIDITVDYASRIKSPLTSFPIWQMGGEISRRSDDESAFGGRSAGITYNIGCCTQNAEGFDEERQWVRDFYSALEDYQSSVYVNFMSDGEESDARIQAAYGPEKAGRLKALKRQWDPDNFFRKNQNISPD